MNTVITKKAAAIIATFSNREKSVYETGIGYIWQDMEHIVKCDREIKVYEVNNPERYTAAIKAQTNLTFRAAYLLQCLGLFVYDNFENMTIEVKTLTDK
jgi:hypothetical protein